MTFLIFFHISVLIFYIRTIYRIFCARSFTIHLLDSISRLRKLSKLFPMWQREDLRWMTGRDKESKDKGRARNEEIRKRLDHYYYHRSYLQSTSYSINQTSRIAVWPLVFRFYTQNIEELVSVFRPSFFHLIQMQVEIHKQVSKQTKNVRIVRLYLFNCCIYIYF